MSVDDLSEQAALWIAEFLNPICMGGNRKYQPDEKAGRSERALK